MSDVPGSAFRQIFWDIIAEDSPPAHHREEPVEGSVEERVAVVIEDDADIRLLLAEVLANAGFTVHSASAGEEGVALVTAHDPVVTTLDVSMPGMDGFETAKRIRSVSATYIVMLTARSEEIDILQGLQSGADDYVTKPFRPRELRARIEAMLRRPRVVDTGDSAPATAHGDGWREHRGLRLNVARRLAQVDGTDVDLTRSEFDIIADLVEAGGRVVSKSDLALLLRGDRMVGDTYVSEHDERAIEVHVANLRRKLGESAVNPRWIATVRGIGYRLAG